MPSDQEASGNSGTPTDATPSGDPAGVIVNIRGDRVGLGPLRRELIPLYQRWINDFEVSRTLAMSRRVFTREAEEAWYDAAAKDGSHVTFTIYELATLRPIGNTDLREIDHQNRTATFGIVIGEKDCWGKGYGTEATRLMLDYGFTALGLHNVVLGAYSNNERGLRAYRGAGFREIGRRREARRLAGQTHDVVYMDCLATEFESPVLGRLLAP